IDGARSIGAARGSVQLEVDPDRLDGVLLVAALADELDRADRAERSLRLRVQHLGMPDARATAGTDESLPSALLAIEPDHANALVTPVVPRLDEQAIAVLDGAQDPGVVAVGVRLGVG